MIWRSCGLLLALAVGTTACSNDGDARAVDVLAASSFTDVAVPLEALLEARLDVDVRFSFGSSGTFFEQLQQGAPAAVVITANDVTMQRLEDADLVAPSQPLAVNDLIIVTADTAAGRAIASLDDLTKPGTVIVVCADSAPCGAATAQLLAATKTSLAPASREPNVRATLTKVLLGEADAAIVYRTDAVASPELRAVEITRGNVEVTSRIASVPGHDQAAAVVDVLVGDAAAGVLLDAGFEVP